MSKKLVTISSGGYTAIINTERGANCISLRHSSGAVILREPVDHDALDNPYLYGMPILFPVNRIEGGRFEFEGREYVFPINEPSTGCHLHGELHRTSFELTEKTESRVVCRYSARAGEYLGFSHAFEIIQEYELKAGGFYHTVTVINQSCENMPIFLGFHTTFNTLFTPESRPSDIRVYADIDEEYERNMELNYLPTGVKPRFDKVSLALADGTYKPFDGKVSRHYRGNGKMSLTDLKNRLRVVYVNDEKYGFRLIFNGGEDGYICLEPQTCLANCQNSPFLRSEGGFDYIESNSSKTYRSNIYVEEILK